MALSWDEIQANAVTFSKRWGAGWDEKSEAQSFIRDFLAVFGVKDPALVGQYEKRALRETGKGFMDYYWRKHIGIEMKTKGKIRGAYEQLLDYVVHLPAEDIPDLLMVSDFETIEVHRRTTAEKLTFKTKDLRKHIRWFADIAGYETTRAYENQVEVNVRAAEKMAKLHDALKANGYEGHELEVYLVRLLFCLFADDTGIFPADSFINYIENSREDGSDLSTRMVRLFEILNMPEETRAKRPLLSAEIKQFRYINGGLFADMLPLADFDGKMRQTLLDCCNFDWNKISPAIFGAMFQGVMDKGQRRELGAHYTSEENILKLINPLFLDELWKELDHVKTTPAALARFHEKIGKLTFLDPACGCGNFLILTYRELRLLELEVLKMEVGSVQLILDIEPMLKVSVTQFYGIEYEDFPCQIAQVGMWLMDHQMNMRVAEHFGMYYARLPLNQSATIVHGNALRIDWEDVVPKRDLSYILGNPPFVGSNNLNVEQRKEIESLFPQNKTVDYVSAWYLNAAKYIYHTQILAAFVSTNSITQGEQVAILWKTLFEVYKITIDFAYRTFKWSNEAKGKAAVHCIIVGFSNVHKSTLKVIYDNDGKKIKAENISPYLINAPNIIIESHNKPICDVPKIQKGNQPTDGGNLIIEENEIDDFLAKEPLAKPFIKRLIGAQEYINNKKRYCLWLINVPPDSLRKMPLVMERINKVREIRLASPDSGARRLAETPMLFRETNNPETFVVVPSVSSERRKYIPIGFLDKDTIPTNLVLIIPDATLYHFGILTSNVHMAWTRAICGRLKSDYRYSKDIVYNNFPWPHITDIQKATIETAAQNVLNARSLFPNSSLADLYDPLTMPPELLKAHKALDRAVMKLYGFPVKKDFTEADCVAALMERYKELVEENKK